MDIREATDAEKQEFFEKAADFFSKIRNDINCLEKDIISKDLMIQARSVWITYQMARWYSDFITQLKNIHLQKDEIQKQIESIAKEEKLDD